MSWGLAPKSMTSNMNTHPQNRESFKDISTVGNIYLCMVCLPYFKEEKQYIFTHKLPTLHPSIHPSTQIYFWRTYSAPEHPLLSSRPPSQARVLEPLKLGLKY